jgi:hypothetical protein
VFTTYYYIFILLLQSFYAESNFEYNAQIQQVNKYVDQQNYSKALQVINTMESKSIFTNNDLSRMKRYLAIKVDRNFFDLNYSPKTVGDYVLKTLTLYQNKDFAAALAYSKMSIKNTYVSDSLTRIYELVAVKSPQIFRENKSLHQNQSPINIRFNEAMNLLDLMKRKEKTLF